MPNATPGATRDTLFWQQYQREPSPEELAEVMQCAKEHVLLLQLQHEPVSLEQPVYSEQETTLFGNQLTAPDDTEHREQQQEVAELLTHLSPQERRVIETRYQLMQTADTEGIPLSYTEVSRQLGMTTELTKTIETRALLKLRFWATRAPSSPGG